LKNSLLWQLEHPLTKEVHYIYGTMHVRNESAYAHIDIACHYLDKVGIYTGEMDLADPVLVGLEQYFLMPTGMTLVTLYGKRKYNRLRKIIKKAYNVNIDGLVDYKPMIVANIIAEKLLTAKHSLSLDHYLWQRASENEAVLLGLESGIDQIYILNKISLNLQKPMLAATAKNVSRYRRKVFKLSNLYADQEITQLYKSTRKSLGKLRKLLLYTRNNKMADRLLEITQAEPSFTAVGAAHLGGKFGILRLMKKSGYKLKPLSHKS